MWGNPHFLFDEQRMDHEILKKIVSESVARQNAHLVDLTTHQHRHNLSVDVYVDTESGISTDELARINRTLVGEIDAFFEGEQAFSLTVSSPGLDRPLAHAWQFIRHRGRRIAITIGDPPVERIIDGTLLGIEDDAVSVQTAKGVESVPRSEISKAVMHVSTRRA